MSFWFLSTLINATWWSPPSAWPSAFGISPPENGTRSSKQWLGHICYRTEGFLYIRFHLRSLWSSVGIQTGRFPHAIFPLDILNCFVSWGCHFHDWSHCCILCWCFSESRWDGRRAPLCLWRLRPNSVSQLAVFLEKKVQKYWKYRQICRVSFLMLTSKREYLGIWHRYRLWKSACGCLWRHWPHNFWNPRSAESKTKESPMVVVPLWENEAGVTCCDQFGVGVLNLHVEGANDHQLSQRVAARTEESEKFRAAKTGLLFTSDVSSRGLDYPGHHQRDGISVGTYRVD